MAPMTRNRALVPHANNLHPVREGLCFCSSRAILISVPLQNSREPSWQFVGVCATSLFKLACLTWGIYSQTWLQIASPQSERSPKSQARYTMTQKWYRVMRRMILVSYSYQSTLYEYSLLFTNGIFIRETRPTRGPRRPRRHSPPPSRSCKPCWTGG